MRQNGRQLQLLRANNTAKTKDVNFITSYQVSSSIHKNYCCNPCHDLSEDPEAFVNHGDLIAWQLAHDRVTTKTFLTVDSHWR